jgi:hypothetical protein
MKTILIPRKYKDLVKSCTDCHKTFGDPKNFPCMIYKVCPLHVPGVFNMGGNGNSKRVRACLLVGKDCACA